METTIVSRDNQWFKRFRSALERHEQEIALEGLKQVRDAIAAGWKPLAIAIDESHDDISFSRSQNPVFFSRALFRSLSETVHSQGVIGLFARPRFELRDVMSSEKAIVVLDGVQDPGNVGTIVRLAVAFNAGGILLTEGCADPFGPKSARASVGAVLRIPIVRTTRAQLLAAAEERQLPLYATSGRRGGNELGDPPFLLVFGSEGQGVSPEILRAARPISIPTSPAIESLNVASAAAILLSKIYERNAGR